MKRLSTGVIVLDAIDIICISFSVGSLLSYFFKKYTSSKETKITDEDIIVQELKKKSPIIMFSKKGNPLKLSSIRGGDDVKAFSLLIKNKRLAQIIQAIINAKRNRRKLRLLQEVLLTLNGLLSTTTGLSIASGGSLSYVQIILIVLPSTFGGFVVGAVSQYPLITAVLPIALLLGQGVEDIPDANEKCKFLCKAAENYHNKELILEMKAMDSLLSDTAASLKISIDKVPLRCIEQPLSLVERFKLKEVVKGSDVKKQIKHFSQFIKKFPECDVDREAKLLEMFRKLEN